MCLIVQLDGSLLAAAGWKGGEYCMKGYYDGNFYSTEEVIERLKHE